MSRSPASTRWPPTPSTTTVAAVPQKLDAREEERGQGDGAPVGDPLVLVGLGQAGGGGPLAPERLDARTPASDSWSWTVTTLWVSRTRR